MSLAIVKKINFGSYVAEEERKNLKKYFYETENWRKILKGEIDIVYGTKGSGKSALYILVKDHQDQLKNDDVGLIFAEKLRGSPIFKNVQSTPPSSEGEMIILWKLYFLTIIGNYFKEEKFKSDSSKFVIDYLEREGLLPANFSLSKALSAVRNYIRKFSKISELEGNVKFDPDLLTPNGFGGKIVFSDDDAEDDHGGRRTLDSLIENANEALSEIDRSLWILLDRLDVSFDESSDVEKNALRALFKVYADFRSYSKIRLKIFIRSDIWDRISTGGFREASHITRDTTLSWTENSLLNLCIRRFISNDEIINELDINKEKVLTNSSEQEKLFYRIFPDQVEIGERQSKTFDWIIKRISDAKNGPAPRELILFLNLVCDEQIKRYERGEDTNVEGRLFSRQAFKAALPALSTYKTTRVLFAEYPDLQDRVMSLSEQKSEQTIENLCTIWSSNEIECRKICDELISIGFFEKISSISTETYYKIPFIYRPHLKIVQGKV